MINEVTLKFPILMHKQKMCNIKWNSKRSGIYAWINTTNGKMYIGQSVNLYKRIYYEMNGFKKGRHQNTVKLYNAINKHGIDNFKVVKLSECSVDCLDKIETIFIKYYDSKNNGYNCTDGGNGIRGRKPSIEQITKQKIALSKYWNTSNKKLQSEKMKMWFNSKTELEQNKIKTGNLWWLDSINKQKHLKHTRESLTISRIEKQRNSLLEYYKNNTSKKRIVVDILSPTNKVVKINGIFNFCKLNNLNPTDIQKVLKKEKIHHKGWHIDKNFTFVPKPLKKLVSPDENLHEFKSVLTFCKDNKLDVSSIKNVIQGKALHYKFWRLPHIDVETIIRNKSPIYKNIQFRFPDGRIERIFDKSGFCKTYGFSKKYLYRFLKNKEIGDVFHGLKLISKL